MQYENKLDVRMLYCSAYVPYTHTHLETFITFYEIFANYNKYVYLGFYFIMKLRVYTKVYV